MINGVNTNLSAQIAGKAQVIAGIYTGNGASYQDINLGVTPKAVLVLGRGYIQKNMTEYIYEALAINGHPAGFWDAQDALSIVTNGFRVYEANYSGRTASTNQGGFIYNYVALI